MQLKARGKREGGSVLCHAAGGDIGGTVRQILGPGLVRRVVESVDAVHLQVGTRNYKRRNKLYPVHNNERAFCTALGEVSARSA